VTTRNHAFFHAMLLTTLVLGFASNRIAQAQTNNCSYEDAALFDGWGWDPVARQSCPPLEAPATTDDGCDYSSADLYDGWGWNPETRQSCPPIDTPATPTPTTPSTPDSLCDYRDAAINGGWGWNATDRVACPPLTGGTTPTSGNDTTTPVCSSALLDPDGDGFGWENNATCIVVATDSNPPTTTERPTCASENSDPDGDGFGWENGATCVVGETTSPVAMSPSGAISTGTPTYSWPANSRADLYRLVVSDSAGNGFTHEIDPLSAGCQSGDGTCSAQPDLAYYDNTLNWKIQSISAGDTIATSASVNFSTPISLDVQPITSNPDACEAYPSVVYGNFVAINNIWNARSMYRDGWSQTIRVDQALNQSPVASWRYDWLAESDGGIYDVKAYPEVIYGNKLGVHVSGTKEETGLPAKVGELEEFRVDFSFSDQGAAERNVALESFFHETCDITGPCDTYDNRIFEMMIWVSNPSVRTPGDLTLTGVMIDNRLWNVYTKPRSNSKYIAFTAQTPFNSGTINWNRFVEWTANWTRENSETRNINVLEPHYCMGAIEIGTEVWNGSGTFSLDSYRITRE
jgi:hypothetical protein